MSEQALTQPNQLDNLVQIRRSSGEKQWVTREELTRLNQQKAERAAIARANKKTNFSWEPKQWLIASLALNGILLVALIAQQLS